MPFCSIFADNNLKTMNIVSAAPVTLSASAVEEIKRLMELEENQNKFLRVGVKGGGCSGLSYILGFDQKQDSDEVYEIGGIPVIMNNAHSIYLMGMEIDWQDGLNARGFSFHNPNASTTCGCGTSFAV